MRILVVTGGIGSGKSCVCRLLREKYGIPVYEADARVKKLYTDYPVLLESIEKALGCKLSDDSNVFVPKRLAQIIFNDKESLRTVESLIFPVLMQDFKNWSESQSNDVVAFESATLLEKEEFDNFGDIVLLITAPMSVRLKRTCARDGSSEDEVLGRISNQVLVNRLSEGETSAMVDHTIINDASVYDLEQKVNEFIEKYSLTKML